MAAKFIMSAPRAAGLASLGLPEIAVAGRSNVGKSSLLGWLLGSPRLVRTSRTPGRTQLLNLFTLDDEVALVDLPGYGYAKLSHVQRAALSEMVRGYLGEREALCGVLLLLDARREAGTAIDREVVASVLRRGRPLLLVITKADLVGKNRRAQRAGQIERAMGVPPGSALMVSCREGSGRAELRARLRDFG